VCVCVCVQTLCLLSFWLLLRQFLTERRERKTDETLLCDVRVEGHTLGERDSQNHHLHHLCVLLLSKK